MGKITSAEYLADLERVEPDDDVGEVQDVDLNESEAERMARSAPSPRKRQDGQRVGSLAARLKPLTAPQHQFATGIIQGLPMRQAYREAYPMDRSNDASVAAAAYKLSKHPKVVRMLNDAWGQTVEVLADDLAATRRWVMRALVTAARESNQEGSRLKALELLGKASGAFTQAAATAPEPVTADQLKKELSGHLRLLDNVKPMKTG